MLHCTCEVKKDLMLISKNLFKEEKDNIFMLDLEAKRKILTRIDPVDLEKEKKIG